jgi:arsenite efflux ATP-binding protein ArsA (TC 3.A.4.1.1)
VHLQRETLSLLKYPGKIVRPYRKGSAGLRERELRNLFPIVEKLAKIPMPEDNVFDDFEYLMDKMQRLQELMLNKDIVSLRVVTTPEKIVISEAKRNFTCLYLYRYNVDAVIVNHIYPDKAMEGYFSKWIRLQEEGLEEIKECFSEVSKILCRIAGYRASHAGCSP